MTPNQIRQAVRSMVRRWERDEAKLVVMFGVYDPGDSDPFSETHRNLATAIAEAQAIMGASDRYIAQRRAA